MTPMMMAKSSMSAFQRRKGKSCGVQDVRCNKRSCDCVKRMLGCVRNDNARCSCWNNDNCSSSKSSNVDTFQMKLMLTWSESQDVDNCLNDKLLKLTFLKGSNNNKLNCCLLYTSPSPRD